MPINRDAIFSCSTSTPPNHIVVSLCGFLLNARRCRALFGSRPRLASPHLFYTMFESRSQAGTLLPSVATGRRAAVTNAVFITKVFVQSILDPGCASAAEVELDGGRSKGYRGRETMRLDLSADERRTAVELLTGRACAECVEYFHRLIGSLCVSLSLWWRNLICCAYAPTRPPMASARRGMMICSDSAHLHAVAGGSIFPAICRWGQTNVIT